jgi:peptidylprolyl isomerase
LKQFSWLVGFIGVASIVVVAGCGGAHNSSTTVGSNVKMMYSLKANDLEIIPAAQPETLNLTIGKYVYPQSLEQALIGLEVGAIKTIRLTPEQAYGPVKPELLARIPKAALPKNIELKVGMMLSGQRSAEGKPLNWRVISVGADSVVVDQNHPLAGKTLDYRVELIKIEN